MRKDGTAAPTGCAGARRSRKGSGLDEQAKRQKLPSARQISMDNFAKCLTGPGDLEQQRTPERQQVLDDNDAGLRTVNSVRVVSRYADDEDARNKEESHEADARIIDDVIAGLIDDYSSDENDSADDGQAVEAENDCPEIEDDIPELQPVKVHILHSDWEFFGAVPKLVKCQQILRNDCCALRVLGADNLMLATLPRTAFASTGTGKANRCAIVHALSVRGVHVEGKRYLYFACKDRGKTKNRNQRTKMDDEDEPNAKEQIWFLAVSDVPSGLSPSRQNGWPTLASARRALADFERCKSLAKASERIALCFSGTRAVFSATWTLNPDIVRCETLEAALGLLSPAGENELHFVILKDTVARNQDGSVNLDENKNPRIMTDGSGLMSLDLAKRLPMVKSGMLVHGELVAHDGTAMADRDAPFGAQVRIRFFGGLAKGMLKSDANLPRSTIVLTESMVKVPPSPQADERFSFDLVETDARPRQVCARTTSDLLPLLEHAGKEPNGGENKMCSLLLTILAKVLEENNKLLSSPLHLDERQFARLIRKLEERAFAYDEAAVIRPLTMFDAGVDPSTDAYLQRQLLESLKNSNKKLSAGKIPIPMSMNLRGYPDCTGTLLAGQVCVLVGDPNGRLLSFTQDVLVYKSPGLHPGDVRKVQCVKPTAEIERRYLKGVNPQTCGAILFSTVGDRSIADMIANSDFDGDTFLVIHDDALVAAFRQQHPPLVGTPESEKRPALGRRQVETLPAEKLDVLLCSLLWQRTNLLGELTALWHAAVSDDRAGAAGDTALRLAAIHSNALDAEKNGWAVHLPSWLRDNARFPSYLRDHPWVSTRKKSERNFYGCDGPLRAEVFNVVESEELVEAHDFHKDEELDWPRSHELRAEWTKRVQNYICEAKGSFKDRKKAAEKCRELLLHGRSVHEIEFGSDDLFAHASAIYFASYGAGQPYFAWHVAGDFLCTMKRVCYARKLRGRTNVRLHVGSVARVWEQLRKERTNTTAPPRMETFMDKLDRAALA